MEKRGCVGRFEADSVIVQLMTAIHDRYIVLRVLRVVVVMVWIILKLDLAGKSMCTSFTKL